MEIDHSMRLGKQYMTKLRGSKESINHKKEILKLKNTRSEMKKKKKLIESFNTRHDQQKKECVNLKSFGIIQSVYSNIIEIKSIIRLL